MEVGMGEVGFMCNGEGSWEQLGRGDKVTKCTDA